MRVCCQPMGRRYIFKMDERNSIFLKMLEFGEEKQADGVDFNQFLLWAVDKKIIPHVNTDKTTYLRELFQECFSNAYTSTGRHVLKAEYYFKLIEYRELSEARKASNEARIFSIIAIIISLISLIIAGFGTVKLDSSTKIDLNDKTISSIIEGLKSDL